MKIYETDKFGWGERRWACEPPAEGKRFRVTRDKWTSDPIVQTVFEWEPSDTLADKTRT